jgi:hypothetical protein
MANITSNTAVAKPETAAQLLVPPASRVSRKPHAASRATTAIIAIGMATHDAHRK